MFLAPLLVLSFLTPNVYTSSGKRVSLFGTGPPVLFSSGLFGVMPRRLYTKLFRILQSDLTIAVVNDVSPVTASTVTEVADALAVDTIAFLSHSSIDSDILASNRIQRAVLCDPVVLPRFSPLEGGFAPPATVPEFATKVVRASMAYESPSGIPELISPRLENADVRDFEGMGHADLLDDTWADLGSQVIPWMPGVSAPRVPFRTWKRNATDSRRDLRKRYRIDVAREIVSHLLEDTNTTDPTE